METQNVVIKESIWNGIRRLEGSSVMDKVAREWELLADKLEIMPSIIEKIRRNNLLINRSEPREILEELVISWQFQKGPKATYVVLVKIMEDMGWLQIGESIQCNVESICHPNITDNTPWNDLPKCYKSEILAKSMKFLGHQKPLHDITRNIYDFTVTELLAKHLNGKIAVELARCELPVLAVDHIPPKINNYISRQLAIQISDNSTEPPLKKSLKESTLVRKQLKKFKPEVICITGIPGSGKHTILSRLARLTRQVYSDRYVVFLNSRVVLKYLLTLKESKENVLVSAVCAHAGKNAYATHLLLHMLKSSTYKFEIFLDTCNELWGDEHHSILTSHLNHVCQTHANIRIILNFRQEAVEFSGISTLCSAIYSLEPLSKSESENALYKTLMAEMPHENGVGNQENLEFYSKKMLKLLGSPLKMWERDTVGTPLKIMLISHVFSDPRTHFVFDNATCNELKQLSLVKLYEKFLAQKLQGYTNYYRTELTRIALELYHGNGQINFPVEYNDYFDEKILSVGILKRQNTDSTKLSFIHDSIADYLVAKHLVDEITKPTISENLEIFKILTDVTTTVVDESKGKCMFIHSVLCYFLDALLSEHFHTKKSNKPILTTFNHSAVSNINSVLQACTLYQYFSLFSYLTQTISTEHFLHNDVQKFTFSTEDWIMALISASRHDVFEQVVQIVETNVNISTEYIRRFESCLWLEYGVNLTPLHLAAKRGSYKIFEYLINKDKVLENRLPSNLLQVIVHNSYLDNANVIEDKKRIIQYLLHVLGEHILNEESGSLMPAPTLMPGIHFDVITLLLEKGANISLQNSTANNIAHNVADYMTSASYHKFVDLLLCHGKYYLFQRKNGDNETAVQVALQKIKVQTDTLAMLIRSDVDLNIECDKMVILKTLVKYGYKKEALECFMSTSKYATCHEELYQEGTTSILHVAAKYQNVSAAEHILSLGSAPNLKDENGKTPLHHAFTIGDGFNGCNASLSKEMINLLLKNGANIKQRDNSGRQPISYIFDH